MQTVRFEGIFVEEQTHFMCRADGGVFRAAKKDVEVVDGAAYVRIGATLEFVRSPIGEESARGQREAGAGDSSACVGGVEISCSAGTVLGACTGVRACP